MTAEDHAAPRAPARRLTPDQAVALGLENHRRGRLDMAETIYRRILAAVPDHADAAHHLGLILGQRGDMEAGLTLVNRSLERCPDRAEFAYNLGHLLAMAGRKSEAVTAYRRAVALRAEDFNAWRHLAATLKDLDRVEEAEAAYCRTVELGPEQAELHSALARIRQRLGRFADAAAGFRRAIERAPADAEAHGGLGNALQRLERFDEAASAYRRAIELQPSYAEAHANLGGVLCRQGLTEEAVVHCRRAIEINPDLAEAHNNLAVALRDSVLLDEAESAYRRAIALRVDYADAHANLGRTLLTRGRLAEGWDELEWRWGVASIAAFRRNFALPPWRGQRLDAGALLVWGEQGVGDEVLYAGMIAETQALAPRLTVECDPRLVPLFARSFPTVEVVSRGDPPHPRTAAPEMAFHSPTGSLPRWFRRDITDFPTRPAYLRAGDALAAALRERYRQIAAAPVIGLSWRSGNARVGAAKSMPLEALAPILTVPGVTFIDLQYGDTASERAAIRERLGITLHRDPAIDPLADLDGFAAQVAAMDLVISVSNTTVHMAGALGKQAWVMVPRGPGSLWYWFVDREDSPWYPSLRLLRQAKAGDWRPVIERVAVELGHWVSTLQADDRGGASS